MSEKEYTLEDVKREAGQAQHINLPTEKMQLIIFKLGTEEYGISIDQIKEVVLTPRIARMPQAPDYIKGVANIRGNIIAILDLEKKFGLVNDATAVNDAQANYTLVFASEESKVGVLVKEVPNTLTINVADIDSSNNFFQLTALDANSITGVIKSGDRLIILIDMINLVQSETVYKRQASF